MKNNDAYKEMVYECKECAHQVAVWNSRDGVTPFGMRCRVEGCKGTMQHINWNLDETYLPGTKKLKEGDLVWIDFEVGNGRARKLAVERIKSVEGTPFEKSPSDPDYEALVESLEKSFEEDALRGSPELATVQFVRVKE